MYSSFSALSFSVSISRASPHSLALVTASGKDDARVLSASFILAVSSFVSCVFPLSVSYSDISLSFCVTLPVLSMVSFSSAV